MDYSIDNAGGFADFFNIDLYQIDKPSLSKIISAMFTVHNNYLDLFKSDTKAKGFIPVNASDYSSDFEIEVDILRKVHNYVASVYTFRECIKQETNKQLGYEVHLEKSQTTEKSRRPGIKEVYSRIQFLYGLRIILQHGDLNKPEVTVDSDNNQATVTIEEEIYKTAPAWDIKPGTVEENFLNYVEKTPINI